MHNNTDAHSGEDRPGLFLRFELDVMGAVARSCARSAWLAEACGAGRGMSFQDIVAAEDRAGVDAALASLASEGAVAGFRCRLEPPGGAAVTLDAEAVLRDGAIHITACDITALSRDQDELRQVLDESAQGFIVHRAGAPLFVNPETARLVKLESVEALLAYPSVLGFIHPDDREFVAGNIQNRMAGQDVPDNYEFRLVAQDGATVWVDCRATLIDWDGQPALLAALYDINDRKRAELAHQQTEALFSKVFQASPDPITLTRLSDGQFVNVNQEFLSLFGYELDEVVGKTSADLDIWVAPNFREELVSGLQKAGSVRDMTSKVRASNGDILDISFSADVLRFGDEDLLLIIGRDISDQKKVENQLLAAKNHAEQASRAKSAFLATMSHEIRTPLNGVLGMVQLLLGTELDERQRSFAETISSSGTLLLTVLNDVLDFSKLEAGKLEIDPAPFELRKMVGDVVDLMSGRAIEKAVRLELAVADEVPLQAVGDAVRLRQILINLISNAIKFTDHGRVTLRVENGGDNLRFAVNDTGKGIRQDVQARIFEEFAQADSSRGGSGLGLAICRKLVELMGGEIGVASVPGHGSEFWFTVPIAGSEIAPPARPVAPAAPVPERPRAVPGIHILVAEDDPVNRMVAEEFLRQAGYDVTVAENGRAALEAVQNGGFDLILMDMQMPEMDGLEATRAIRALTDADRSSVPIIAFTASAMQDDARRCEEAGMNGLVLKPVSQDALFGEIGRVLDLSQVGLVRSEAIALPDAKQLVHREALQEIRDRIGNVKFMELVEVGQRTIPADMGEFREAMESGDISRVVQLAHRLAGATGLVGLTEVRGEFLMIEEQLRIDSSRMPAVSCDELETLVSDSLDSLWSIASEFSAAG